MSAAKQNWTEATAGQDPESVDASDFAGQQRQFHMRADQRFFDQVDGFRRRQPVVPGRSDAVRRLVEMGIAYERLAAKASHSSATMARGGGAPAFKEKDVAL
jgi:hypothetical protein